MMHFVCKLSLHLFKVNKKVSYEGKNCGGHNSFLRKNFTRKITFAIVYRAKLLNKLELKTSTAYKLFAVNNNCFKMLKTQKISFAKYNTLMKKEKKN